MTDDDRKPLVTHTASGVFSDAGESYLMVVEPGGVWRRPLPASGTVVIGRAAEADIQVRSTAVSRQHARIAIDGGQYRVEDLNSHNGTRVNDTTITGPRALVSGDTIRVGDVHCVLHVSSAVVSRAAVLSHVAMLARLRAEVHRAREYDRPLSLLCIDVGDADDKTVATFSSTELRPLDVLGRSPDGYVLVLCIETTEAVAREIAERLVDALVPASPELRVGVSDFPDAAGDAESLFASARRALEQRGSSRITTARGGTRLHFGDDTALVVDPVMKSIYTLLEKLAGGDMPVLMCGETGVGKDLAARAVHAWSPRNAGPFVAVNCAALPANLVESELFGYTKGAFSGATTDKRGFFSAAQGGTIFLDELGELDINLQSKLLRALDRREIVPLGSTTPILVDVRVVSATNRDIITEIAEKRFREDLYYRLGAAMVVIPPLRDRAGEIPLLARELLANSCERTGRSVPKISEMAMRQLSAHHFPGNVRELANAMDYAATVASADVVEVWHLPANVGAPPPVREPAKTAAEPVTFRPITEEIIELEARRMREALAATNGNQSKAAKLIGMPRRSFTTKLTRYGLRATSDDDED